MKLISEFESESRYTAKSWDKEDAFRYIYEFDGDVIEAGFFKHHFEGVVTKYVVELSTSFGCPVLCQHCASGDIPRYRALSSDQIVMMCEDVLQRQKYKKDSKKLLVTYSGIGEGALQASPIFESAKKIFELNSNAVFNFSTVGFNPKFIKLCDEVSEDIPLNKVQLTYLHHSKEALEKVVPSKYGRAINFSKVVQAIRDVKVDVRINFVMIRGFNDTLDHWRAFSKYVTPQSKNMHVRISKLNPTKVSSRNGFQEPDTERLYEFLDYLRGLGCEAHIFTPETNNNMNCGQLSWTYSIDE